MNITPHPPASFATDTRFWSLEPPPLPPCLHLDPPILFVSTASTFFALLQRQSCYNSSTLHSSFPFTPSVANLSVCTSALSPFCPGIPASSSIKCFCIPSAAAARLYSPTSDHPAVSFRSIHILSQMLDKGRKIPGSKFIIYQDALKCIVQKVQMRVAAAALGSNNGRDRVSDRTNHVWPPGCLGVYRKPSFVWTSGQILANISNKSRCLFQVTKVI